MTGSVDVAKLVAPVAPDAASKVGRNIAHGLLALFYVQAVGAETEGAGLERRRTPGCWRDRPGSRGRSTYCSDCVLPRQCKKMTLGRAW